MNHQMIVGSGAKLLAFPLFLRRMLITVLLAGGFVLIALAIGALGYHYLAKLRWVDSVMNAAMILTGMGPVDKLETNAAKIFASCYALFSGLVFITIMGVVLAPLLHRFMHKFHLEDSKPD